MADETTRPGYRGKCLYKTGKCENERALKTSGQAHNLCEEHRNRQNEHQRKLDAKNRYTRKDKRVIGTAKSVDGESPLPSPATSTGRHRYAPYGKVRMSPTAANGMEDKGPSGMVIGPNGVVLPTSAIAPPMMQFHAMSGSVGGQPLPTSGVQAEMLPNGVVILPNGPQPPQVSYPMAMQDFDGIVVPLPSYLEGHERIEFRSRIYQKVLDFIAEECMRRFGAPPTKPPPHNGQQVSQEVLSTVQPLAEDSHERAHVEDNSTTDAESGVRGHDSQRAVSENHTSSNESKGVEADNDAPSQNDDDANENNSGEDDDDGDDNGGDSVDATPAKQRATRNRVRTEV